jgi:hypothetical protein
MNVLENIIEKLNTLPLEKQEEVLNYVESISQKAVPFVKNGKPYEWLDIGLKANLQGPPDCSEHLDDYLYGDKKNTL